jgi:hypothetical protein
MPGTDERISRSMNPSAQQDAEIYRTAARLNREDALLRGSTLVLPNYGQLVVTADMHGHRRNFERTVRYCDLARTPARHLILQELIHEEPSGTNGMDMSHELLLEAAKLKCAFPDQVHFLQSNHELAQLIGQEISKAGRIVTFSYESGVRQTYGSAYPEVLEPMMAFLRSYALAARTANGVLVSHSLPSPEMMTRFDPSVLNRELTDQDLADGGSAYLMVWGRYQTGPQLDELARLFDAQYFICGHQPQETGYDIRHDRLIILASDHNHGTYMAFDLKKDYDVSGLEQCIRPLAGLA